MNVLAIDPGHTHSAYVVYDDCGCTIQHLGKIENELMLQTCVDLFQDGEADDLVIEQIACMGMAVGAEVFETVFWSGRFCQAAQSVDADWHRVKRHEVKMHLCGNMRAKDANIRQRLIDRFSNDQGRAVAIGTKKNPGPLYGVSADMWSALAVAVTWGDRFAPALTGGAK